MVVVGVVMVVVMVGVVLVVMEAVLGKMGGVVDHNHSNHRHLNNKNYNTVCHALHRSNHALSLELAHHGIHTARLALGWHHRRARRRRTLHEAKQYEAFGTEGATVGKRCLCFPRDPALCACELPSTRVTHECQSVPHEDCKGTQMN